MYRKLILIAGFTTGLFFTFGSAQAEEFSSDQDSFFNDDVSVEAFDRDDGRGRGGRGDGRGHGRGDGRRDDGRGGRPGGGHGPGHPRPYPPHNPPPHYPPHYPPTYPPHYPPTYPPTYPPHYDQFSCTVTTFRTQYTGYGYSFDSAVANARTNCFHYETTFVCNNAEVVCRQF